MGPTALTYSEAGAMLGVSARTVIRLVKAGKMLARRLAGSRSVRIERSEVKRYLQSSAQVPRDAV